MKKVLIVAPSLGNGGAERAAALLSSMLFCDYEVVILTGYENSDFDYKGKHVSLGLKKSFSVNRLLRAFFKLLKLLWDNKFEAVIDFRARKNSCVELFFSYFVYRKINQKIYTIHNMLDYFFYPKWIQNIVYQRALIVVVADQLYKKLELTFRRIQVICNSIDFKAIDTLKGEIFEITKPFVVTAGRMDDDIKRFDNIIKAYANSVLPEKGVQLVILGDGKIKPELIELSKNVGCEHLIRFEGFQKNPFKYFAEAQFFILASRFEGFPMVLIESLACCTPVISYDCPTGPSEIINDGHNGLLIENGNIAALSTAISRMHTDEKLYAFCKNNARQSVDHLAMEHIQQQWLALLETTAV